jgi:enterobactin synthetase component D / holo-[acyl-carrier protein] synthase
MSTAKDKDGLRLPTVGVSVEGGVGLLTLGRPAANNAMNFELLEDLAGAVRWCGAPGRMRALVITGAGRDFSVGGDLETLRRGVGDGAAAGRGPGRLAAELGKTIVAVQEMRCPVIAAINGRAGGGGFSLALACDVRVASERAVLDFAYHRIGATPDGGMTWFLPAVVGPSRARELLLEAPIIRAQRALEERLVSRAALSRDRQAALRRFPPGHAGRAARRGAARARGEPALRAGSSTAARRRGWGIGMMLPSDGPAPLLAGLLPAAAATAEALEDDEGVALFPEEAAAVEAAVRARRAAFSTGRACARRALSSLGIAPVAIAVGRGGAPRWPAGIVGSITHCDGFRGAAVARARDLGSIGIDAEPNRPLPDRVLPRIALEGERAMVRELASSEPGVCWDRLLFSAKEAVYKTYYPLGTRLTFSLASLSFDVDAHAFEVRIDSRAISASPAMTLSARWTATDHLVVAAVTGRLPDCHPKARTAARSS